MFNINKGASEKVAYLNYQKFFDWYKLEPIKDTDLGLGEVIER